MEWSRHLWRRSRRIKTTAVGVAAALCEAIIESTNALQARLRDEGLTGREPERFSGDECLLECTLFEWFLRDVVIPPEFGPHAGAIRQALAGRVLVDLQRSGLCLDRLADFDRRWPERFAEYTKAVAAAESLQALGAIAWSRISGNADYSSERGTMFLARRATGELAGLAGLGAGYAVVPMSRRLPEERLLRS